MSDWDKGTSPLEPPVGIRIRDAILVFNVPQLEGHLEPDYHFAFLECSLM